MSTIANLAVLISANLSQLDKDLSKAQGMLKSTGASMSKIGGSLTKSVTLPLVGLGTAAVMTVAKFDDSMSKVQAITGATTADMAQLRDMAKELGSQTRFSASEAADAMTYLGLAGWDTNQILAATPDMLSLAAAAGMDLATAADIVSDTMSAFAMNADRGGEAADVFAKISASANTNVLQLGEAMKYSAATANAAGMDLQQTSAILGVLADSGIKGSMAGTTFANMLKEVKAASIDGAFAVGEMAVEVYRQDGSMRDLGAIMADVETATKGMTAAQRDASLGMHFGERAMRGVNIMLATGSDRYNELADAAYNSAGAAADMAETMEDNIGGAMRALKSQAEGVMIQLGEQLVPILRNDIIPLVQQFGRWLSDLIKRFSEMDPAQRQMIIRLVAIAAAAGPVLVVVGKLLSGIGSLVGGVHRFIRFGGRMVTAIKSAGGMMAWLAANPVGLVIAGIAAVIAIGVLLYKNWDKIAEVGRRVWTGIVDTIKWAINGIIGGINSFIKLANRVPGINIPLIGELELSTDKAARQSRDVAQTVMDDYRAGRATGTAADMALFGESDTRQTSPAGVGPMDQVETFGRGGTVSGPLGQPRWIVAHGGETMRTPQQERALGGGSVTININNPQIANDYDVERIADQLVTNLRVAGIIPK